MQKSPLKYDNESALLLDFNNRVDGAFEVVYDKLYFNLIYFTQKQYNGRDVEALDVVHDILIKVWTTKKLKFSNIKVLKVYLYTSIRNHCLNEANRVKIKNRFLDSREDDYLETSIIETESISEITLIANMLPEQTAEIFKYMLNGWEMKEIAEKTNRSLSYVYAQKDIAIKIIKNKHFINKIFVILQIISNI